VRKSEFKVGSYSQLEGRSLSVHNALLLGCALGRFGRSTAAAAAGAVNFLRHCISRPDEQLN
jgi:hypothetical protein